MDAENKLKEDFKNVTPSAEGYRACAIMWLSKHMSVDDATSIVDDIRGSVIASIVENREYYKKILLDSSI